MELIAQNKLGRTNHSEKELAAFRHLAAFCYDKGVAKLIPLGHNNDVAVFAHGAGVKADLSGAGTGTSSNGTFCVYKYH